MCTRPSSIDIWCQTAYAYCNNSSIQTGIITDSSNTISWKWWWRRTTGSNYYVVGSSNRNSLKDLPTIGLTSAYNFIPSKNTCDFLSTKCFMIFIPKGLFELKKVQPQKKRVWLNGKLRQLTSLRFWKCSDSALFYYLLFFWP